MSPEEIEEMNTRELRQLAVRHKIADALVDDIARLRRKLIELGIEEDD